MRDFHTAGFARVCGFCAEVPSRKLRIQAESLSSLLDEVLMLDFMPKYDLPKFKRAGERSKAAILASILAAAEAGMSPLSGKTAVVGAGRDGSHPENLLYWTDYVQNGRSGGRGHLFVGTLPSTPPCETAIALNVHGPSCYIDTLGDGTRIALEIDSLFDDPELETVLLLLCDGMSTDAYCLVRGRMAPDDPFHSIQSRNGDS
ncbi:MAG: hypothetical protein BWY31_01713 [Lentisphaerae bacterium ADurb.Bin242]|nr:MAG: hypothetical protein BWY31_01713 [Lentisphaerae bacterium ADurb.Bin242]